MHVSDRSPGQREIDQLPDGLATAVECPLGLDVDLYKLAMGPFNCIRRRHTLDRFGVHVDENVFGNRFRRRSAGWSGITGKSAAAHRRVKRQHYRIDLP